MPRFCLMSQQSPTRRALTMIGDKWSVLVIFALKEGPQRLSAMQRMIEGITQKMLIQTLRKMEENGLVERTIFPVMPPHVEYRLTTLGQSLLPVLYSLADWAEAHQEALPSPPIDDVEPLAGLTGN